MHAQAESGGLL